MGVTARTFTAELPGSGLLTVSGTAHRLDATLAGSGNMQLGNLTARSVTATVPGSGRIDVHATQTLNASIPGQRPNRLQRPPENRQPDRQRLRRDPPRLEGDSRPSRYVGGPDRQIPARSSR